MVDNTPLVAILGPTAVGKTGFGIQLAQALNGEIINADSRQIYRHMDIGTAKPTPEQLEAARHHLLDIVNPDENLGLAQYQRMVYATIEDIYSRGKLPLLVGGTGQYITAVIEGWSIPEVAPNPALRAELEDFAKAQGSAALHARLRQVDPDAAAKIEHQNVRRVIRALEVFLETGQTITHLQRKKPPPYKILQYGLTMERDLLNAQADQRVDLMMQQGFLDEVGRLLEMGYSVSLPSMSAIGYAQLARHLLERVALDVCVKETKIATHQFIRKQYTWFKGHDREIQWYDVQQTTAQTLIEASKVWLEGQG
jgi:tRNA dimethylallyltransferase